MVRWFAWIALGWVALAVISFAMAFSLFGVAMSIRQAKVYEARMQHCRDAGGVPYKAKHAPVICLRRDLMIPVDERGRTP